MTPKRVQSGSAESDPYAAFLFVFVVLLIAVGFLFAAVRGHPVGTPIVTMVGYTILMSLIAFKFRVPWDRLTRGKFLLAHCLVLAVVYAFTTWALAAYPHLPKWLTATDRRGRSLFTLCVLVISLVLAFCEYSWVLRDEGEEVAEAE